MVKRLAVIKNILLMIFDTSIICTMCLCPVINSLNFSPFLMGLLSSMDFIILEMRLYSGITRYYNLKIVMPIFSCLMFLLVNCSLENNNNCEILEIHFLL